MNKRLALLPLALVGLTAATPALAQRLASRTHAPRVRPAPNRVMGVIGHIAETLRTTRYSHSTSINEHEGRYVFDCSAMATWVLTRAAPEANAEVMRINGRGRPVARDFHDAIAAAPTDHARHGWLRIAHPNELREGDVIAWRRPPTVASRNTGHVLFVASPPRQIDREGRRFLVRIVDSTSIPHGDDTRPREHQSGFGYGTILLYLDRPDEEPAAYGWYGLATRIDFRTHLAMGRAVR